MAQFELDEGSTGDDEGLRKEGTPVTAPSELEGTLRKDVARLPLALPDQN